MKKPKHFFRYNPVIRLLAIHVIKARGFYIRVTVCLFFPGFLFAQNLIKNSGFDQGYTPWSASCSVEINPETVYGGSNSNNLVSEIDIERCLSQDICVADNTTYTISLVASRRQDAPATTGFHIYVNGNASGTSYVSQNVYRTNTVWQLTPETFTFTIPAGSADKTVNMLIVDNMGQGTFGILLDDIEMHPGYDMSISELHGLSSTLLNEGLNYSVLNSPSDVSYAWSFDAASTPGTSNSASPSVSWSTIGTKTITVDINNGACTIAELNTAVLVTAVLPTQVTSFTGNITGDDKAILRWTANEENTSHFVIERSADGVEYNSIAVIFSQNIAGQESHSYTDDNYSSPDFYRLKQVDVNGHASYSPVVILKKTTSNFTTYPSSPTNILHYAVTLQQPAAALLQIMNTDGQTVLTQNEKLYQGVNAQMLDISHLPAGFYFLKFSVPGDGTSFVRKFNKL